MIKLEHVKKVYKSGKIEFEALKDIDIHIGKGEFVAIIGPSGSGKSTIMNILGCLDQLTEGKYILDEIDVSKMNESELATIRNKKIGFVFQAYNLLDTLTALENVELPLIYGGVPHDVRQKMAKEALRKVGLADREEHLPTELSGGQKQRVAIARAIVNNPSILMEDEPTGHLDSHSEGEILQIFKDLNANGSTIVMVTHEPNIAEHCKRIITCKDGEIIKDEVVQK